MFPEDSVLRRESSAGVFMEFPESPLSMRTPTPQAIDFAIKTSRLEAHSIINILLSIPEIQQRLIKKFSDYVEENGQFPDVKKHLWAVFAAQLVLNKANHEVFAAFVTRVLFPLLESVYDPALYSLEMVLDVWDNIFMNLGGFVQEIFFFPATEGQYILNIHMDLVSESIITDWAAHCEKSIAGKVMPRILTFGLKRQEDEHVFVDRPVEIPELFNIGPHIYERVASIEPENHDDRLSPLMNLIKNKETRRWNTFIGFYSDCNYSGVEPEEIDHYSLMVFYVLSDAETVRAQEVSIPESLYNFASQIQESLLQKDEPEVLERFSIDEAVVNAGSHTAMASILMCLLGNPRVMKGIVTLKESGNAQAIALYDFFDQVLMGNSVDFTSSAFLQLVHDRLPTELSLNVFNLWSQLASIVFPFETNVSTDQGRIQNGFFIRQSSHNTNLVVLAPNDEIKSEWVYSAHGQYHAMTISFSSLQTHIHPKGDIFAIGINRLPIAGEELADRIKLDGLVNDIAQPVGFVCYDKTLNEYYAHFMYRRNGEWKRAKFWSNEPITLLSEADEDEVIEDISRNAVLIVFMSMETALEVPATSPQSESSSSETGY